MSTNPVMSDESGALEQASIDLASLGIVNEPRRSKQPSESPQARSGHGPARVIALCNQKGGVGKTTSTINLGAALAECDQRVLLVDFDPQGALSVGLGVNAYDL